MRMMETHGKRVYEQPKKKQHKFDTKRFCLWVLTIISVIGLLVVMNYNTIQSWIAGQNQTSAINTKGVNKYKPSYSFEKVKPVSAASLADAYRKRGNYKAIGQVAIPELNINLNIYQGVGNTELNLGAGAMKPNQRMGQGNYSLAGHNMDDNKTFFSPLYSAKVNNKPVLKGLTIAIMNYKTVYYYTIQKAMFIKATDTYLLKDYGYPKISLFTCDYTGAGRLVVIGKYQKKQKLVDAPSVIKQAFKKD